MFSRLTGLTVILSWAVAMTWLFEHDILPEWTAQDPPKIVAADWVRLYGEKSQFGIFDSNDRRIGNIWTHYASGSSTDREDDIYLDNLPMLGPAHVHIKSVFDVGGVLDEIDIHVLGSWSPIRIHGERFPSQFAIRIDAGIVKQVFKIDLARAGTFSDVFRPFDAMPNIREGQSWRMQTFNPLAAVTGVGSRFIPMLVKVTGRDLIRVNGELRDCWVLQTSNPAETSTVEAWVDRKSGVVLVQKVRLPIGSSFTVAYEDYDESARMRAVERFKGFRHGID